MKTPAPRIYCIPATAAPVVAVFRRGPTRWAHLGRWDLDAGEYQPGAWLKGRIFPRRSDLSPDGTVLCYFAHKPGSDWEHGEAYVALSKLPWLTALHAFGTCGTWTRGYAFRPKGDCPMTEEGEPPIPFDLCPRPPIQFAVERDRGWVEAPGSPARDPNDVWDERRNARLQKTQTHGDKVLVVESVGVAGGEFGSHQAVDGMSVIYSMEAAGELNVLDDLQWADWDRHGRLLAATRSGKLQIRETEGDRFKIVFEEDLARLEAETVDPPPWAKGW